MGFARGQLSADTRKLLRQELGPGGRGGRPVALTPIPHLMPFDPEDTAMTEGLLDHTGGWVFSHFATALGEACRRREGHAGITELPP